MDKRLKLWFMSDNGSIQDSAITRRPYLSFNHGLMAVMGLALIPRLSMSRHSRQRQRDTASTGRLAVARLCRSLAFAVSRPPLERAAPHSSSQALGDGMAAAILAIRTQRQKPGRAICPIFCLFSAATIDWLSPVITLAKVRRERLSGIARETLALAIMSIESWAEPLPPRRPLPLLALLFQRATERVSILAGYFRESALLRSSPLA